MARWSLEEVDMTVYPVNSDNHHCRLDDLVCKITAVGFYIRHERMELSSTGLI